MITSGAPCPLLTSCRRDPDLEIRSRIEERNCIAVQRLELTPRSLAEEPDSAVALSHLAQTRLLATCSDDPELRSPLSLEGRDEGV